ncbi:hypothetical protein ACW95P_04710, partial [Candidatus Mycoplasma pogonae]
MNKKNKLKIFGFLGTITLVGLGIGVGVYWLASKTKTIIEKNSEILENPEIAQNIKNNSDIQNFLVNRTIEYKLKTNDEALNYLDQDKYQEFIDNFYYTLSIAEKFNLNIDKTNFKNRFEKNLVLNKYFDFNQLVKLSKIRQILSIPFNSNELEIVNNYIDVIVKEIPDKITSAEKIKNNIAIVNQILAFVKINNLNFPKLSLLKNKLVAIFDNFTYPDPETLEDSELQQNLNLTINLIQATRNIENIDYKKISKTWLNYWNSKITDYLNQNKTGYIENILNFKNATKGFYITTFDEVMKNVVEHFGNNVSIETFNFYGMVLNTYDLNFFSKHLQDKIQDYLKTQLANYYFKTYPNTEENYYLSILTNDKKIKTKIEKTIIEKFNNFLDPGNHPELNNVNNIEQNLENIYFAALKLIKNDKEKLITNKNTIIKFVNNDLIHAFSLFEKLNVKMTKHIFYGLNTLALIATLTNQKVELSYHFYDSFKNYYQKN